MFGRFKFKIAALALGFLAASAAFAQTSPDKVKEPWVMLGKLSSTISVGTSSSATALPPSAGFDAWVCNTGSNDAYLDFWNNGTSVSATVAGGSLLKAASCGHYDLYPLGQLGAPYTYIMAIVASGTTTLYVETGVGNPPFVGAIPGSGSGSQSNPFYVQGANTNGTDSQATTTNNVSDTAFAYVFNGTTWDRLRSGNGQTGSALGSALVQQVDGLAFTLTGSGAGALTNGTYATGAIPTNGFQSVGVETTAISGSTLSSQQSNDNVTWYSVACYTAANVGGTAPVTGWSTVSYLSCPLFGSYFRLSSSGGTATTVLTMKVTPLPPIATYVTQGSGGASAWNAYSSVASSTGGLANFSRIMSSAATTNATLAKSSAGRVYKVYACNTTTTAYYIHFTNLSTTPTPGTSTVFFTRAVPTNSTATSTSPVCTPYDFTDIGAYFSAGIGYWLSTGVADNDATALAAAQGTAIEVGYQ